MKKKLFISLILAAFTLTACDLSSMFNFGGGQEEKNPYIGHYLEELYTPTKVQAARLFPRVTGYHYSWYSAGTEMREEYIYAEDILMGGEEFYNVYNFNSDTWLVHPQYDTEIVYELPEDHKWKSLCFAVGAIDRALYGCLNDKIALKLYLDCKEVAEEYFQALMPVRYFSYDISGAKEIKFYSYKKFDSCLFGIGNLTVWEDAKHSIEPQHEKAAEAEDFFDNTKKVYRYNYSESPAILHELEKSATIDGVTYDKGVIFSPSNWNKDFDTANPYNGSMVAYNTFGRYKYIHFQIGHADKASTNGALHFVVMCDGKVLKHIHVRDDDIISTYCIDINYGHIVSIQAYPDRQVDENQKDVFSTGKFGLVNVYGSPSDTCPIPGATEQYNGSYKLLTEYRKPYNFINDLSYDNSLFLAESRMLGFQMGGELYNEGLVMRSIFNISTSTLEQVPARADFNLAGHFKYISFKVGRRDRSALTNDTLRVYCDDTLVETYILRSIAGAQTVELDINNCSKFTLELEGSASTTRGTYGIFDIAVHTDKIRELDFYHVANGTQAAKESYPDNSTVELMKDIRPYESLSALGFEDMMINDRNTDYEYLASDDRSFMANGESHQTGFVLQTGKYVDLGGGGASFFAIFFINGFFLLQDVKCSSFASFNLGGHFNNLHFDICSLDGQPEGATKRFQIFGDDDVLLTRDITSGSPTHFDVNITGINNLIFYLEYGEDGVTDSTIPFAFYNLTVTNF